MLSIFKNTVTPTDRRVAVPKVEYLKDRMEEGLARTLDYYHFTGRSVNSDHILVRLITSVTTSMKLPMEQYLWEISDDAPSLAKTLGIGSYVHNAKIKAGTNFYGSKCYELIQLRTGYFNYGQPWETVEPIRVKVHPRTDLSMLPLDGRQVHDEDGLVVIGLDLEALMYMYRGWYESERNRQSEAMTTKQFVATRVIPSMLKSHLNVAWFNRLASKVNSYTVDDTLNISGVSLPPLTSLAKDAVDELYGRFTRGNYRLTDLLVGYPMLFTDTLHDITRIDPSPVTLPIKGYELLVENHYLVPLLQIDKISPGDANSDLYNEIRRHLRRSRSEKWLEKLGLPLSQVAILTDLVK